MGAPLPAIWGIVNVTPDSFSDGGQLQGASEAVAHALALAEAGAHVLDIGGESTRPGADAVPYEEECARVLPVIRGLLAAGCTAPISIDTRHARVAAAALKAGATIVNDVAAGRDPGMFAVVASAGAEIVLMHMQGTPCTMQAAPHYEDVCTEVRDWLAERVAAAVAAGIPKTRILVDPGIGFGKTLEHNLALLQGLDGLTGDNPGVRVLLGASRKRFLGALTGREVATDRLAGSLACVAWAAECQIAAVRVHDVAETRDLVSVLAAIRGSADCV